MASLRTTSFTKAFLFILILLSISIVNASELSEQATAFYSDNNHHRTLDLILQIDEKDRTAQDWILLGNVLADKGESDNAVYMYQKALEADKKSYRAYYNIGNYYMQKGKFNIAIENYKKATSIKGDNPYIFYNLGCAYLKQNDLKKARANFNKVLMYKSDLPECHYNLAYVYQKLGKPKLAETFLFNYQKLVGEG